ncbi:MAG: PAS domain S-box protein [Cyanobacteria bacterium SZAS LIN-5]|nr:PAS domain S-box protein [Cyanobacteria bacterium SZAS LIN-5]
MKLATKGLLIVGIPVAIQVLIVVTFASLIWRAQTYAAHQAHAKEVIGECDKLILDGFHIGRKVLKLNGENEPVTDDELRAIKRNSSAIEQQLAGDGMSADASAIASVMNTLYEMLLTVKERQRSGDYTFEKDMFRIVEGVTSKISKVINTVNDQQIEDDAQRAQLEQLISNLLFASVPLCIIVTLGLAYFAYSNLRRPLARMSINAERMSKRLPLEAAAGQGKDELAQMDQLFHDVNNAVNEAFERERNLITNAADVVCSIDEQGNLIKANPYTSLLMKFDEAELAGISIFDLVSARDCDKVDNLFQSSAKSGTTHVEEVQMLTKDKTIIETVWSITWSQNDQSYFCVIHDISERKKLEQLKQDFIAMLSHDLRTPLMSLNSSLELVESGAAGQVPPDAQPQLIRAIKNTEHLIELVNDLLDFEKLEAGRMDFDLANIRIMDIIEEARGMVESLATAKNITITIDRCDSTAHVDSRRTLQVLINLLSNALKHAPESSTIAIKNRRLDDKIELSVHDCGAGVPEELSQTIFSPFEQVAGDPHAKLGTGLGLAICKLIVEGQGGTIGVRPSDSGKGSGFWFTVSAAA